MKKRITSKVVWTIILILSILICLLCAGYLVKYFFLDTATPINRTNETSVAVTSTQIEETAEVETQTPTESEIPAQQYAEDTASLPEDDFVNFEELMEINPDIYAWIYIPNTNVDNPVAQSAEGVDDSFYLSHNVYKNYQFSGTIYTEKKNKRDFTDPVTVLYGHNMLNGSMFASLHNFNDKTFFDNNNTIFVFTKDKVFTYLIYSAYQYDDRHILNSFDMDDNTSFRQYLDSTLVERPYYCNVREDIELSEDDRIITLSTCMNGGGNVRYLVQGVLVNEQMAE